MGIELQLWDCCPKDFQASLRNNGLGNESTEPEMLTKSRRSLSRRRTS